MSAIEKVLVATDLSTRAGLALRRGATLARQHGAELHLMHAMPQFSLKGISESFRPYRIRVEDVPRWVDAARAQLHAQAQSASAEFGIEIHEHAVTGNAIAEIELLERSLPADILLIGAQGEGFLRHLLLGSTAAALVQHAIRPLLVAKAEEPKPYLNALVGITFSMACRNALEAVARLAPKANVTALHAVRVPYEGIITLVSVDDRAPEVWRLQTLEAARREVDDFINGPGSKRQGEIVAEFGHAAHLLVDRAKTMHADLIAVGKRSSGPVDALFGTVAKRVIERADCDVLVVP